MLLLLPSQMSRNQMVSLKHLAHHLHKRCIMQMGTRINQLIGTKMAQVTMTAAAAAQIVKMRRVTKKVLTRSSVTVP